MHVQLPACRMSIRTGYVHVRHKHWEPSIGLMRYHLYFPWRCKRICACIGLPNYIVGFAPLGVLPHRDPHCPTRRLILARCAAWWFAYQPMLEIQERRWCPETRKVLRIGGGYTKSRTSISTCVSQPGQQLVCSLDCLSRQVAVLADWLSINQTQRRRAGR